MSPRILVVLCVCVMSVGLVSTQAVQADQSQSERLVRILVPNYDELLQSKLDGNPEYEVLVPRSSGESDQLIRQNIDLYLKLQDEIFREGGLSAALSEIIQSMIKVSLVTPTEREIDRFYFMFEHLTPSELAKLREAIPAHVREVENVIQQSRARQVEEARIKQQNERDEAQERLMMARMGLHVQ